MKIRQIKPIPIAPASIICTCIVCLLCACGGGGDGSSSDTGSISFSLDWVHPGPKYGFEKSPSGNVCVDYLIETVRANVKHSSGTDITESWDCSDRGGTIDMVPKGSGYSVTIDGIVAGNVDWNHQVTGITVTGGQDTDLGTVEMAYVGDDQTRPTVTIDYPESGDTNVVRNTNIIATFSEDVVDASVNTSSCTVYEDGTSNQVSSDVTYDSSTGRVTIDPSGNLAENTTYRVTITTEVEDHAGLTMASDVSWTFSTGLVIGDDLLWDDGNWDESFWQ